MVTKSNLIGSFKLFGIFRESPTKNYILEESSPFSLAFFSHTPSYFSLISLATILLLKMGASSLKRMPVPAAMSI